MVNSENVYTQVTLYRLRCLYLHIRNIHRMAFYRINQRTVNLIVNLMLLGEKMKINNKFRILVSDVNSAVVQKMLYKFCK